MTNAPPHPITARFTAIIADLRLAIGMACRPPLAAPLVYLRAVRCPTLSRRAWAGG